VARTKLEATIDLDSSLCEPERLGALHSVLIEVAPTWAQELRLDVFVFRGLARRRPREGDPRGALRA
jgi:hypothetical protein